MIVGQGRRVTLLVMAIVFSLCLLLVIVIVMGVERFGPALWPEVGSAHPPQRDAADGSAISSTPALPDRPHAEQALSSRQFRAPAGSIPLPDPSLAGVPAEAEMNPGAWFSGDAYPADAIRRSEQGRVVAKLFIDAAGSPTRCTILISSKSASLDSTTCAILMGHARFKPARDRNGVATVGDYTVPVRWVLPEE